jgi:hypothetical protein
VYPVIVTVPFVTVELNWACTASGVAKSSQPRLSVNMDKTKRPLELFSIEVLILIGVLNHCLNRKNCCVPVTGTVIVFCPFTIAGGPTGSRAGAFDTTLGITGLLLVTLGIPVSSRFSSLRQ